MKFINKNRPVFSFVDHDALHFIVPDQGSGGEILEPLALDTFLMEEPGLDPPVSLSEKLKEQPHRLMIVPDYWVGNSSFTFQAKKKALVEAFLTRKLQTEQPDLPAIKDFFDFDFYKADEDEKKLYVHFLQEPVFFRLYTFLASENLAPQRITAPYLIWKGRLQEKISSFHQGGLAFVHLLAEECFLYFFFHGNFLFSRNITFPQFTTEDGDNLETLVYEINQSIYSFSQKTRLEINQVYLASFETIELQKLSEELKREVKAFDNTAEEPTKATPIFEAFGPLSRFDIPSLLQTDRFSTLAHKQDRKEQEWRPVQTSGIIVGLCLCLLLLAEGLLLWNWSRPGGSLAIAQQQTGDEAGPLQTIPEYQNLLTFLLMENQRPAASLAMVNLARALPKNASLTRMSVEIMPAPCAELKAVVTADSPKEFKESLATLMENLHQSFQGSQSLGIQDIDFDTNNCSIKEGRQVCNIAVRFNLP